jgi:hypothetical protein
MSTETLLLIVIIMLVAGVLPVWPHSRSWGYTPTGVLTVLLIIFLVWALAGDRPLFRHHSGRSLEDAAQDAGEDIKSAGRDVASSVRKAVN